jgi:hypothetical protein
MRRVTGIVGGFMGKVEDGDFDVRGARSSAHVPRWRQNPGATAVFPLLRVVIDVVAVYGGREGQTGKGVNAEDRRRGAISNINMAPPEMTSFWIRHGCPCVLGVTEAVSSNRHWPGIWQLAVQSFRRRFRCQHDTIRRSVNRASGVPSTRSGRDLERASAASGYRPRGDPGGKLWAHE